MQKIDFIRHVAASAGVSQKVARQIVDSALEVIAEALSQDERVTLSGFGTFEVRERSERGGVHPHTGDRITIPATRTPGFTASTTLKLAVRGMSGQPWEYRGQGAQALEAWHGLSGHERFGGRPKGSADEEEERQREERERQREERERQREERERWQREERERRQRESMGLPGREWLPDHPKPPGDDDEEGRVIAE